MRIKPSKFINEIPLYSLGDRENITGKWNLCDLNESYYPPSPSVREKINDYFHYQEYPEIKSKFLITSLSNYVQVPEDFIQIYNGSDGALLDIFTAYLDDSKRVLLFSPSYTQIDSFIAARTNHVTKREIIDPMGGNFLDFSGISEFDLVYIANPNNPTGKVLPVLTIAQLVASNQKILFVIDEAYFEFWGESCANLTEKYSNIIVTRTFSKAFGLAGLRLGYTICNPEIKSNLDKIYSPKNVNQVARIAGLACLEDLGYYRKKVSEVITARTFFEDNLPQGFKSSYSKTNFLLLRTPSSSKIITQLKSDHILVRDRSQFKNLENCVRISFGELDQVKVILKSLSLV